jgi:hypothetical protein
LDKHLFPDPSAEVVVESVTVLEPAVFKDEATDLEYSLPLWSVKCYASLTVALGQPKYGYLKKELDRQLVFGSRFSRDFEVVSTSADDMLTARGLPIQRVCVQVLDLVCMLHKMEAEKNKLPKALAATLSKMARSAACAAPNFTRALTVNGRTGGTGCVTLHDFLEQVTFVTTDDRRVGGETVLDRMVALAGQYVAKYLWDTYEFREGVCGEEGESGRVEKKATRRVLRAERSRPCRVIDDDSPATVQVWMTRQMNAGLFEHEADRSRIRHFLSRQRKAVAVADPEDAARPPSSPSPIQHIQRAPHWFGAPVVKFPRYCHPFEMGSVVADSWSLEDTCDSLNEFDSRMMDIKSCPKVKEQFDSQFVVHDWSDDDSRRKRRQKREKASDKKQTARHAHDLLKTRGDE